MSSKASSINESNVTMRIRSMGIKLQKLVLMDGIRFDFSNGTTTGIVIVCRNLNTNADIPPI